MTLHPYEVCSNVGLGAVIVWAESPREAARRMAPDEKLVPDTEGMLLAARPWLGGSRGEVFAVADLVEPEEAAS